MTASRSPALQWERTALAWDRTGLAFLLVGALLVRVGGAPYLHARHLPALLSLLAGLALVGGLARASGPLAPAAAASRRWLVRATGAAAVGVSLGALWLAVARL